MDEQQTAIDYYRALQGQYLALRTSPVETVEEVSLLDRMDIAWEALSPDEKSEIEAEGDLGQIDN